MLNLRPEYILISGVIAVQVVIVFFWWRYLAQQFKSTYRAYDTLVFTGIFTASIAIVLYIIGNKLDLNTDLLLWLSLWPLIIVTALQFVIFNLEVSAIDLVLRPLPTFIVGYSMSLAVALSVVISDVIDPIAKVSLGSLPVVLVIYLVLNLAVAALLQWKSPRLVIVTLVVLLISGVVLPVYAYFTNQLNVREMSFWAIVFLVTFFTTSVPIIATNARRKASQAGMRA